MKLDNDENRLKRLAAEETCGSTSVGESLAFAQEKAVFEFTETISRIMNEDGISVEDLRKRLGDLWTKRDVQRMLDGQISIDIRDIVSILYALDCTLVSFMVSRGRPTENLNTVLGK